MAWRLICCVNHQQHSRIEFAGQGYRNCRGYEESCDANKDGSLFPNLFFVTHALYSSSPYTEIYLFRHKLEQHYLSRA